MEIVDINNDGIADRSDIYRHSISDIAFLSGPAGSTPTASQQSNNLFAPGPLSPGQKLRLGYILTDYDNGYTFNETRTPLSGSDNQNHNGASNLNFPGTGFKNDGEIQGMMLLFRGEKIWPGAGVVFINNPFPAGSNCTWDALNQKLGQ